MPKFAMITGASRGIGADIAKKLASEGYHLYLLCKSSKQELISLARHLEDCYHINCVCFIGDVGNASFIRECFQNIDRLDVLINNAGISYLGLLSEMTDEAWDRVIATNLSSAFYTCRSASKCMLRSHSGKIINLSSVWGNVGASMEVAYSASKGGLNSFTKALAKELAPSGIQVNAIACGVIDTSMNHCFSQEEMTSLIEEIPADRIGKPEEVADFVVQILHAPSYLTGQIITLDGGWQ